MSEQNVIINIEAFADDKLKRKFLAENLKTILLNTTSNVFSINAPWGGGKSYFINNLEKLIGNEAICISYNAWESDYYKNPLIPLVTEIVFKLEQIITSDDGLYKELVLIKTKAKELVEKTSIQLGFNFGIFTIGGEFDPNKPTIESDYIALKTLKEDFKNKLILLQENINKNIIIFIDELDRCNPKYAIETLESIKHFFGIKNIIFVLAVDKKQIENTVKTIYGVCESTCNINGYLRKFLDVEINLPTPSYESFIKFQFSEIIELIEKFKIRKKYYDYGQELSIKLIDIIVQIVDILNFQPRDIEKLFLRVKLTIESLNEEDILLIEPIFILNALYIHGKDDFINYVQNNKSIHAQSDNEFVNKINKILPYWKNLFTVDGAKKILQDYARAERIAAGTKEANIGNIKRKIINVNPELYLANYTNKIAFIGYFE